MRRWFGAATLALGSLILAGACGADEGSQATEGRKTTTSGDATLAYRAELMAAWRSAVTNDDSYIGVGSVELRALVRLWEEVEPPPRLRAEHFKLIASAESLADEMREVEADRCTAFDEDCAYRKRSAVSRQFNQLDSLKDAAEWAGL